MIPGIAVLLISEFLAKGLSHFMKNSSLLMKLIRTRCKTIQIIRLTDIGKLQ